LEKINDTNFSNIEKINNYDIKLPIYIPHKYNTGEFISLRINGKEWKLGVTLIKIEASGIQFCCIL
jgi:hypothetical protein